MPTGDEHRAAAERALHAAKHLRPTHPEWAIVPLFYAAMHLLHAWFDDHAIPVDQRHPSRHKAHRGSSGQILYWGTTDVVANWCGEVSAAYKSLFNAGRAMRYSLVPHLGAGADQRFWDDFEKIRAFAER